MLNSLEIKNFRALEDFRVEKLGRVNLIVGKNNSGKSTVLEALRIYAGNGNPVLLREIAKSHDEPYQNEAWEEEGDIPFQAFYTGRKIPSAEIKPIVIGSNDQEFYLKMEFSISETIEEASPDEGTVLLRRRYVPASKASDLLLDKNNVYLSIEKNKSNFKFPLGNSFINTRKVLEDLIQTPCGYVPSAFIDSNELGLEWDKLTLGPGDDTIHKTMSIITPEFEGVRFVQKNIRERSAIIKLRSYEKPLPLKSLGEGVLRALQLALKFHRAANGFLLIDEFENGLHYSVQEKVWALVFKMAQQLDIQVFATTHSWDCIQSFAKVARERQDVEGVLFRVGRSVRKKDEGKIIATVFDEEELYSITQNSIEVR